MFITVEEGQNTYPVTSEQDQQDRQVYRKSALS